jgi:hypothetical protein
MFKKLYNPYEIEPFITNKIQGTNPWLEALSHPTVITAVYSPPRHDHFLSQLGTHYLVTGDCNAKHTAWGTGHDHLSQLGTHYLVTGDWNAKHTAWGTRLTTVKGKNLLQVLQQNNLLLVNRRANLLAQ